MNIKSITDIYKRYKCYLCVIVLSVVCVFSVITFCRSGMIYNLIPSNADNYVLIIPHYDVGSINEKKVPKVNIYNALTRTNVKAKIEYLEGYGQYVSLMKRGVYRVEVVYNQNTIEEAQLKIVPGTDAYVMDFAWGNKLVTHLNKYY